MHGGKYRLYPGTDLAGSLSPSPVVDVVNVVKYIRSAAASDALA